MPVRFRCDECGQLLSIARRKGGSHINCPRCRNDLLVPKVDADLEVAVPHRLFEEDSFDKILGRKGTTTTASRPVSRAVLDRPMTETGADATDSPLERDDDFPYKSVRTSKSTISAPKRSGYWLEGLTIASILGSFGLGVGVGRYALPYNGPAAVTKRAVANNPAAKPAEGGDGIAQGDNQKPVDAPAKKEAAPAKPVCKLGGTVFFANEEKRTPDVGAVVILLPTKLEPGRRIKVDGLRPNDPDSNDQVGVADVARYGGSVSRVAADGSVNATSDKPGQFRVLIISKNIKRDDQTPIYAEDRANLSTIFEDVDALIGKSDYRWFTRDLKEEGTRPLETTFTQNIIPSN